jgi:hypothetical protein
MPREARKASAPNDVHENRLRLVIKGMPQSYTGSPVSHPARFENLVPDDSRCLLKGKPLQAAERLHISSLHDNGKPALLCPPHTVSLITVRLFFTKPVVDVEEQKLDTKERPEADQYFGKSGGIRSSGEGNKHHIAGGKEGMLPDELVDLPFQCLHRAKPAQSGGGAGIRTPALRV